MKQSLKKSFWLILLAVLATLCLGVVFRQGKTVVGGCSIDMKDTIDIKRGGKLALLIHGYPEPIYKDNPIYQYFDERGYSIIAPYLFSPKFKLTDEEVKKYIDSELDGKKPDVIIGVSLGGLIAPYIGNEFPAAKLVLIGTGPYVRTETALDGLTKIGETPLSRPIFEVIKRTPTWLYSLIYNFVNHPNLSAPQRRELEAHIKKNWDCVTSIPYDEDKEVLDFLISTDNTSLLRSLKNKTLIFAGEKDVMMPVALSERLHNLIKGSELVISTERLHYSVFDDTNWKDLDIFLGK